MLTDIDTYTDNDSSSGSDLMSAQVDNHDSDYANSDSDLEQVEIGNDGPFEFTQERFNDAWFYADMYFKTKDNPFTPIPGYDERFRRVFPQRMREEARGILVAAIEEANAENEHSYQAFKSGLRNKLNNLFGTNYTNTLCRPTDADQIDTVTGRVTTMFTGARMLDLSQISPTLCCLNDETVIRLLQTIPHHIHTVDLSGCFNKERSDAALIRIFSHLPPNVSTVRLNDNWHSASLLNHTEKTAGQIARLTGHLPMTVKHIDLTLPEGQKHHQSLIQTTRERVVNERIAQFPDSYDAIYNAHARSGQLAQARALLNDYAKGNNKLFLFFTCHAGRSYTREVAALVRRINNPQHPENITSMEKLLVELKRIEPANPNGSLARRTSFIEYQYSERQVESELQASTSLSL